MRISKIEKAKAAARSLTSYVAYFENVSAGVVEPLAGAPQSIPPEAVNAIFELAQFVDSIDKAVNGRAES